MNHFSVKQIDQIINENFQSSFMNNSKWEKLIDSVTDQLDEVFIKYKLIHSSEVHLTSIDSSDFKPFFIEPILYKEVEWIEFPVEYENYINSNNLKAGKKHYKQDLELIEKELSNLGNFEIVKSSQGIRIYAYK